MLEDIRNADATPAEEERRLIEQESLPLFAKVVVALTMASTAANVAVMKLVALGGYLKRSPVAPPQSQPYTFCGDGIPLEPPPCG
jgi:hypothetical protein